MNEEFQAFQSELLGERYYLTRHRSGLSIYVFPKKMTTAFALLATKFGSVDRTDGRGGELPAGVAHFLEHKMFSNADGTDSFERFSSFGADANAYTAATRTVYHFSAVDRFEESLLELIRFVTQPYFTAESVKRERSIIAEEILQAMDNPYNRAYYGMLSGLYCTHPVRDEICGTLCSIKKITPEVLYRAYEAYYCLSNMTLIVCGNVEPEAVLQAAERVLPDVAPGAALVRPPLVEPPTVARGLMKARGQVAMPTFCIGVKDTDIPALPTERARKDACMSVLSEMLFSPSGELYNRLLYEGRIGVDFSADYTITESFAFLRIAGEAADPEDVFREICAYVAEKQKTGLSREDFERCRRVAYAEYIKGFDSTEEIAEALLSFVQEGVEPFAYAELLRSMAFSDVEALLGAFFQPSYFTLSAVYPEGEVESEEKK